jgi:redox-sensitive bicupin YhaK (pirin superfamily)
LVRLRIEAEKGKAVIFKKYWKQVTMRSVPNSKSPLEILFIAEISLNEPVARYGPFLMNSNEEINQAMKIFKMVNLKQ